MCGCKERRGLIGQTVRNAFAGKPVTPQVRAIQQTVRQDLSAIRRAMPRLGR